MLRQPEGATVDEVASVTGWQRHTVRGVFSGTLKKKLGLTVASAKEERGRVYRIAEPANLLDLLSTLHRLASTLASRPRVSVQTAAETTVCETRTWPGLIVRWPGCERTRSRSGWDREFESGFLQRGVSNEPCACRGRRTRVGLRVLIRFAPPASLLRT